ncbi:MAG: Serine/threonine protein kinaselike protein [Sphaerisporangium sp.]|nr:Serine/threonine protein kinaselike protein [Sphaerisporangium sp.]
MADRYQLLEPIGRGGMGTVWRAHDELLDRAVAVKEIRYPGDPQDDEIAELNRRTLREARAAGRLTHPNVVVVHDVIEENGRPWIVMQLVDSRSLGQVLRDDGPLPVRMTAEIGLQILEALRTAHAAGVLHRDVKPENVLLTDDGRVVLTDFGIARMETDTTMTRTGLVGTPAFIAPERLRGHAAQRESDLWSLGATLYAAVEGRPPHDKGMAMATMHAVLNDEPEPALRAGRLGAVLSGLLEKNPAERLTADQAERMLRSIAEDRSSVPTTSRRTLPATPLPVPATSPPRKPPKEPRDGSRPEAPEGADALEQVQSLKQAPAPGQAPPSGRPPASEQVPAPRQVPASERPEARKPQARPSQAAAGQAQPGEAAQKPEAGQGQMAGPANAPEQAPPVSRPTPKTPVAPVQPVKPSEPAEASSRVELAAEAAQATPAAEASRAEEAGHTGHAEAHRPTRVPRPVRGAEAETRPEARKRPYAEPSPHTDPRWNAGSPVNGPGMPPPAEPDTSFAGQAPTSVAPSMIPMRPGEERTGRPLPILRIALATIAAILVVAGIALWLGARHAGDIAQGGTNGSSASATAPSSSASGTSGSTSPSSPPASPSETATPTPTPTPTPSTSSPADTPAGWHKYNDGSGFSIALPKGWRRSEQRGTQVIFRGPDPNSYLLIDQTSSPKSDAKKDWENQEPGARGRFGGYKLIRIKAVDYWKTAADWEFTFGGGRSHVINRGFVTDKHHGYAIYWKTAEKDWNKNLDLFHTFTATFQPAK